MIQSLLHTLLFLKHEGLVVTVLDDSRAHGVGRNYT